MRSILTPTRRAALALISSVPALSASATKDLGGVLEAVPDQNYLALPPGTYRSSGLKLASGDISIVATIPGTVTIMIDEGCYFLDYPGFVNKITLDGIKFVGGNGAIHLRRTKENVSSFVSITRCEFLNYSICAIGNNSSDYPYLIVRDCAFQCEKNSEGIGISWGGYVDGGVIENCYFVRNKYSVKLGPRLSGSFSITRNSFYLNTKFEKEADIWLVPNSECGYGGVNSGFGIMVDGNKFGNEYQTPGKPRIIVAEEDLSSGHDRQTRHHSETWSGKAVLSGLTISNHRISAAGGVDASFLKSYISELRYLSWLNNKLDGAGYNYLVEFAGHREKTVYNSNWNVQISSGDGHAIPKFGFCNIDIGTILDPDRVFPSYKTEMHSAS